MKYSDRNRGVRVEPRRWADRLTIRPSNEGLDVGGEILPFPRVDLLHDYGYAEVSPHILFANCRDDDSLIDFVGQYGPVVTSEHSVEHPPQPEITDSWQRHWEVFLDFQRANPKKDLKAAAEFADKQVKRNAPPQALKRATQRLDELRNERSIFNAAMDIVRIVSEEMEPHESKATRRNRAELRSDNRRMVLVDSAHTIVSGTSSWAMQHSRDQRWQEEQGFDSEPGWKWSHADQRSAERYATTLQAECELSVEIDDPFSDPFRSAQFLVCSLLNAFPVVFEWVGNYAFEDQPFNALEFGIRPILYAMLRNDLKQRRQLRRCALEECGKLFLLSRPDRVCCDVACSKKRSSREYYEETLKPKRQKAKRARSTKGNK